MGVAISSPETQPENRAQEPTVRKKSLVTNRCPLASLSACDARSTWPLYRTDLNKNAVELLYTQNLYSKNKIKQLFLLTKKKKKKKKIFPQTKKKKKKKKKK